MSNLINHPEYYNTDHIFPGEKWKIIPGYNGTYWASSIGRVLSRGCVPCSKSSGQYTKKAKILKPSYSYGYPVISLSFAGKSKQF